MTKKHIPFKEDPAKASCNHAFYGVKSIWPFNKIENRDSDLAVTFGSVSSYVIATGGEAAVNFINRLGANISLNNIVDGCLAGIGLGVLAAALEGEKTISEKFTKWVEDNPIYSAGVYGIISGAFLKSFEVLYY